MNDVIIAPSILSADFAILGFCLVDELHCFCINAYEVAVHLVLCEVLNINLAETAKAGVHCYKGCVYAAYLHTFHKLACEVKAGK